jgi:hypothetical protein
MVACGKRTSESLGIGYQFEQRVMQLEEISKTNLLFPTNPSVGKKEKEKKADLEGLIPVDTFYTKSKNRLSCG